MKLQQLLKNYESFKKQKERSCQSLRADLQRSIEEQTISALKLQNYKVNQIHKNQQAIEGKLKKQQELLTELKKDEEVWVGMYEQLNRALMQAGDLLHYAGYVEAEIKQILGEGSVAEYLQEAEREETKPAPPKVQPSPQQSPSETMYEQIIEKDEKFDPIL